MLTLFASLEEMEIPDIQYHKNCWSSFTFSMQPKSIAEAETVSEADSAQRRTRESKSLVSRVYDEVCLYFKAKIKQV